MTTCIVPAHRARQNAPCCGEKEPQCTVIVAILGCISLLGMVIRNSVILIDQIETEIANGRHRWDAVIVATEHRLRPILLTAAAAILGMIPIAPAVFWGPMAYAVIGGLGRDAAHPGVPARA
jgi:multidrug efflux pump subunit AcrB